MKSSASIVRNSIPTLTHVYRNQCGQNRLRHRRTEAGIGLHHDTAADAGARMIAVFEVVLAGGCRRPEHTQFAIAALKRDRTIAQIADRFDVQRTRSRPGRRGSKAADVFDGVRQVPLCRTARCQNSCAKRIDGLRASGCATVRQAFLEPQ